jgi:hypothetical protein
MKIDPTDQRQLRHPQLFFAEGNVTRSIAARQ